jgi:predicted MFS family arabinose efflux permease
VGPVIGGLFYEKLGHGAPFITAGILGAVAFLIILSQYSGLPVSGKKGSAHE